MNTKPPRPPPYPVGSRVKYIGKSQRWRVLENGSRAVSCEPGMIVPIIEAKEGRQGTGRRIMTDDNGHDIYDETEDGFSTYDAGDGGQWIIWPDKAHEWELLPDTDAPPRPENGGDN